MKIGSWAYTAKKFIFLQTVLFYALTLKVLQNKSFCRFCYILVYSYFPSTKIFSVIMILLTMAKHRQIIDLW